MQVTMIFRNFLFYLGIIPATLLFTTLGLSGFFLPFKLRYYLITRWSHFFIFWAKTTCGLNYKVEGLENLPSQPAIVLANHQSMWETIFMQVLLPPQSWVFKRELLKIPIFGWGVALLEPIAINRKSLGSIKELTQQGSLRLKNGRWLIIFPEGTRVAPHAHHPYSRTGAALAKATGYPIVPIAHNAGVFWPRGFFIQKPGTIRVAIGSLIQPAERTATEINTLAESWIREKLNQFELEYKQL